MAYAQIGGTIAPAAPEASGRRMDQALKAAESLRERLDALHSRICGLHSRVCEPVPSAIGADGKGEGKPATQLGQLISLTAHTERVVLEMHDMLGDIEQSV